METKKIPLVASYKKMKEKYGVTFGQVIKKRREELGFSLRGLAREMGIAAPYLSDLENDRRYPPVGEVLEKMLALYKFAPEEQAYFFNLVGKGRKEVAPDLQEKLMSNETAHMIVRQLVQLDLDVLDDEEICYEIIKAIHNGAKKKGIELITDDEDTD